jgi:hypothetical protein
MPPAPPVIEAADRGRVQRKRNIGPARVARAVTVRKGGQHALMAEFLLFVGIVGMRAVADYVPHDEGTSKGEIQPTTGQLGPLPILAAGFVFFFILSFLAARGGTWARLAAIFGLIVDVALLMRSAPELETVAGSFGNISGQASTGSGSAGDAEGPGQSGGHFITNT